ncbi:MAG: branched-chain amino acid ABC transporter substrate-binding protein [Ktedonobacteraceae bacterium]|nr:branched-chain amino acid ABC transporter substrate-binding protein [Chloroflexota bacterium]
MRRISGRIMTLAMGLSLLLAILASCGAGTTGGGNTGNGTPTGSTIIKVASDFPVSGKDTSSGKPAENGAHMAVDEANASNAVPGYKLVFVPKDDVGPSGLHDPSVGQQLVRGLIGDALVAGIVGPFNSSVAKAEMPITNKAPIAQISPANTNTCLTQEGADKQCGGANDIVSTVRPTGKVTYFRIATTDSHQGPALADWITQNFPGKYKSVYVIDDAETYGIGIADTFQAQWTKLGLTVLGRSSEPSTTTSYVSLLTQIASKHPDLIYFGGLDSTGGILIRQQMSQVPSLKGITFAGGDGLVTPTFASTVGKPSAPVFATVAVVDTTVSSEAASFRQKYSQTYSSLNVYSAAAYDCMKILINAIGVAIKNGAKVPADSNDGATAKTFRQAVIDAIAKTDYNGVTGHHTFDQNGDTTNRFISVYSLDLNAQGKPDWLYKKGVTE